MKLKPGFAPISIMMGMLGLAACGQNSDQVVYQYPETAILFDNFHILKTVYTSGEMKLYYRGMNLDGCQIECYDADFTKLSGEFEHTLEDGVLTIKAEFAEKICGLTIGDRRGDDTIYRLRYLDSSQFAWLADTFWYDYGWMELGDVGRYYSAEELEVGQQLVPARESWTCLCGATNAGKYCMECGISKPPDNFSWTCSCGAENKGKFCTECGRPF